MAAQQRKITLNSDQADLLKLLVNASAAIPDTLFHCEPLWKVGFTWIMHPGLRRDARVAKWDDMLLLDECGLIDLSVTADQSDSCTFPLTELGRQAHERCQASSTTQGDTTFMVDVRVSTSD